MFIKIVGKINILFIVFKFAFQNLNIKKHVVCMDNPNLNSIKFT